MCDFTDTSQVSRASDDRIRHNRFGVAMFLTLTFGLTGVPFLLLTPFDTAVGGMMTSVIGWIPLVAFIGWLAWSGRVPVRRKNGSSNSVP